MPLQCRPSSVWNLRSSRTGSRSSATQPTGIRASRASVGSARRGAARLLNSHGPIEAFPPALLGERMEEALLFKRLATLRTDAVLFDDIEALRWNGPTQRFAAWTELAQAPKLLERARQAHR